MRPEILHPFFYPVGSLKGVGPKISSLCEKLCGTQLLDVVTHLPKEVRKRDIVETVAEALAQPGAILPLRISKHTASPRQRGRSRLPCRIETKGRDATLDLVFFNAKPDWLRRQFPVGEVFYISGKCELFRNRAQITHPDIVIPAREKERLTSFFPVYRLTSGLSGKMFAKIVDTSLQALPDLPEWLEENFRQQQNWPDFREALWQIHHPDSVEQANTPARSRLAHDEALAHQLTVRLMRAYHDKSRGRAIKGDGGLRQGVSLPFELTGAQQRAIKDILGDMACPSPMRRLLQGDVGAGKTVVAFMAILNALETGLQACLMVPSEILARQHEATLNEWLAPLGKKAALLTSAIKGKAREDILRAIASGDCPLIIGTHALFQENVAWHDLGLIVVDEQHRFGVHQRLALYEKGREADMLIMSATPIPRTITLALWGDVDLSRLDEKPAGRKPIITRAMPQEKLEPILEAVERNAREKTYWICPLIEETDEKSQDSTNLFDEKDAAPKKIAAEDRAIFLRKRWGAEKVALVHGRMSADEKKASMRAFIEGPASVLVATTVIEVGVDVPEASRMIIENAEHFGLAQLHQLRGRVGRGSQQSSCILLYAPPLSEMARQRLEIIRTHEDGFFIAEEDLRLRGAGDRMGTRQSGLPSFHFIDLALHKNLMVQAGKKADEIMKKDPFLQTKQGEALKTLLHLFSRQEALQTIRSG